MTTDDSGAFNIPPPNSNQGQKPTTPIEHKKLQTSHQESGQKPYYKVSGGPIMVTLHSNTLLSSTNPAENPSTGFLQRSAR